MATKAARIPQSKAAARWPPRASYWPPPLPDGFREYGFSIRPCDYPQPPAHPLILALVWPLVVFFASYRFQSDFAERVVRRGVASAAYCRDRLLSFVRQYLETEVSGASTCDLGNLAFLALHAPTPDLRSAALTLHEHFTKALRRRFLLQLALWTVPVMIGTWMWVMSQGWITHARNSA